MTLMGAIGMHTELSLTFFCFLLSDLMSLTMNTVSSLRNALSLHPSTPKKTLSTSPGGRTPFLHSCATPLLNTERMDGCIVSHHLLSVSIRRALRVLVLVDDAWLVLAVAVVVVEG